MQRRKFIRNSIATMGASVISTGASAFNITSFQEQKTSFRLNYAPHIGMFKELGGKSVVDQLRFMAASGFRAFEDNEMRNRPIAEQEQMAETMASLKMQMGVFVAHEIYWDKPNLANGDSGLRDKFLQEIEDSVTVAKRVKARWMTVVPGHVDPRLSVGYQTANVIESLKQAAALLEPHGLIMVLEPLNFRDHPGMFLNRSDQAYEICKAVDSSACKILFDVYHQQIQEGNLIPNIEACWDEIAYFQMGDNPGRKEPYTGEINYQNVFKYIYSRGFDGVLGMEHGNSLSGAEGERKVIEAYRKADNFM
ncbi:hydroxypyruvate isomerase family protein [Robertkochia solimangrovi]|uniref:hydroxypyruvate isomerase family protein n=1 Tax=Robertkochia solimangrovi TaxID=2213046 RepID=UPI0011814E20|nr:TIM barrel protein [Robertkochia solimangrovi]TRZ46407.1 xylose isomerase [Robertkochia solimangrovi]